MAKTSGKITLKRRCGSHADRAIVNPATEDEISLVEDWSPADVDNAVQQAKRAFEDGRWSRKTPGERSAVLFKWASLLEANAARLAKLESENVGKPIKLATDSDIPFAIDNLKYFAGVARHLEGRAAGEYAGGYTSFTRREPLGVVGLVAPWNYPLMMAVWKAGPALAAGNTAVLKPSRLTPLTALELARLAEEAGVPEGVFQVVTGSAETGMALTSHKDVAMVSLTGDTETGKKIMAQGTPTLKKLHLELGGKAPFVVFEDADLDAAVNGAVVASFVNSGQDCTAATRIYVHESVYKKFLSSFVDLVAKIRVGDPSDPKTDMGPLVSADQRGTVEAFMKRHTQGKVLCGGKRPTALPRGFFFEPTVVADVPQKAELMQREVFGPVVCLASFKTEEEAIQKANDVAFGLASSVWTSNVQRALRVSAALRFGTVWINDHLPLASELPHGGLKLSGFGKDLSSWAIEEYTMVKHVMADTTGLARKPWHQIRYNPRVPDTPAAPDAPLLRLEGISKAFGSNVILRGITLEVHAGEFVTLLGPSGCGKTTTLRVIAGFERPDEGRVFLGGADVTDLPPYRRDVHTVFQQYALFPHLNVFENVAFGLRLRGVEQPEVERLVRDALSLVKLGDFGPRRISQISGGQQQRVAVARALVGRPSLLLLDEPLGALDLKLRKTMQLELKELQRQLGLAFVYVTHDQEEALTMSDRIAVFNYGRIEQFGSPKEIYETPRSSFVADFIGAANILDARLSGFDGDGAVVVVENEIEIRLPRPAGLSAREGDAVCLAIRPERIEVLFSEFRAAPDGPLRLPARVREVVYLGSATQIFLQPFKTGKTVVATTMDLIEPRLSGSGSGKKVWLRIKPADVRVLLRSASEPSGSDAVPA